MFSALIPDRYKFYWKNFVNLKNKMVDNLKIPLITKNGHELMISWAIFPIKNIEKNAYDINLVGNLVTEWYDIDEKSVSSIAKNLEEKYNNSLKLINDLKQINLDLIKRNEFLEKNFKKIESKTKKKNKSDGQFFEEKYKDSLKSVNNLKKINSDLVKKNEELEKDLRKLEERLKKKSYEFVEPGKIVNKGLYSISELFGGRKRRQEFENIMHELDEREKILNNIESKLVNEKKKINEQIIEFKQWRQKLEQLEQELENRHMIIDRQEKLMISEITGSEVNITLSSKDEAFANQDIFDKIPGCAAIIQRGILKKVNESFAGLIGYNTTEIINKSFFEFISPEGFSDIERFYFNRLKGEDTSFYQTILITKDNDKINVEVSTKPTFFNGEKADITVVKKIDLLDVNKN